MRSELQTHAEGAGSRATDRRIYTYRDLGGGAGAEVRRPRLWRDSDHVRQLGEPSVHEPLPAAVSTISPARGCPSSVAPPTLAVLHIPSPLVWTAECVPTAATAKRGVISR